MPTKCWEEAIFPKVWKKTAQTWPAFKEIRDFCRQSYQSAAGFNNNYKIPFSIS